MEKQKIIKIEISRRTIIFTVFFLLFLWFIYQVRQTLLFLFVGVIIMSALNPLVEKLEKIKIPRVLAVIFIYLLIFLSFALLLGGIIPSFVDQTRKLISLFPSYYQFAINDSFFSSQFKNISDNLGNISFNLVKLVGDIFENLLSIFVLVFISFYILLERKNLELYFVKLFGREKGEKAFLFFNILEKRLGSWVRAQIILMIIVGLMLYLGLKILGVEYALSLALIGGILEVIPNLGPTISSIPAIIAGLSISPIMGLAVLALYFLVQQIENHIIVPQVMRKGIGFSPLITILALIIGFKLGGVLGSFLSLPFVIVLETFLKEFLLFDKKVGEGKRIN